MRHSNNKSVFIADLLMMLRALEKDRVPVIVAVSLFSYLEYMAVKTSDSRLSTSTHEFGRGGAFVLLSIIHQQRSSVSIRCCSSINSVLRLETKARF